MTKPQSYSVSQITGRIKESLARGFSSVWVRGEVSGLMKASSGHVYFRLKDDRSQLSAMIWESNLWRVDFELKDGMELLCQGNIDVFAPRGTYSLSVRQVHQVGLGAKQQALENLRQKMKKLGWFDASAKKPLPRLPKRVAVVTSPQGAAIRDFVEVIKRRWPLIEVIIVPSKVQGDDAGPMLANGVRKAAMLRPKVDIVVVSRGGGSVEDLWCFNDGMLCKAIHECEIPVVTGVGHEIDHCLCDFVADVRALTPTEAAERIVPDRIQVERWLDSQQVQLKRSLVELLERKRTTLERLAEKPVLRNPLNRVRDLSIQLDYIENRLTQLGTAQFHHAEKKVLEAAARLESLSPLATLARGYSITTRGDSLIRDVASVSEGDLIETRLQDGKITSRVENTESS